MNKVALITGSSRGIGRVIANTLASKGYNIVIAAKTTVDDSSKLDGTIYDVKNEIQKKYGVDAIAVKTDLRDIDDIKNLMFRTELKFGRLDVLVNNASALWWKNIENTPENKYNLINNINSRASYILSRYALSLMEKNNYGHIIMHSPPLPNPSDIDIYKNKTAYMISKLGMTMTAMGIAAEYRGKGIAANTIWPETAIESAATINMNLGKKKDWRKPDIIADSISKIIEEDPNTFNGNQLTDEMYLRSKDITNFDKYQCVPGHEPPKLIDVFTHLNI